MSAVIGTIYGAGVALILWCLFLDEDWFDDDCFDEDQDDEMVQHCGSSVVDWDSPTANIYGCQPCPKCGSKYRASYRESGMIECDDCGLKQPYTLANPDEEQSR